MKRLTIAVAFVAVLGAWALMRAFNDQHQRQNLNISTNEETMASVVGLSSWELKTQKHDFLLDPSLISIYGESGHEGPVSKDQSVLYHLWATWCAPCLEELPLLLASYQDAKTDSVSLPQLVLVAVEGKQEPVEAFLRDLPQVAHTVFLDPSMRIAQAYAQATAGAHAPNVPMSILYNGEHFWSLKGSASWSPALWQALIVQLPSVPR